jgi:hypothetical protein
VFGHDVPDVFGHDVPAVFGLDVPGVFSLHARGVFSLDVPAVFGHDAPDVSGQVLDEGGEQGTAFGRGRPGRVPEYAVGAHRDDPGTAELG